jgi:hypothetical protein
VPEPAKARPTEPEEAPVGDSRPARNPDATPDREAIDPARDAGEPERQPETTSAPQPLDERDGDPERAAEAQP